MVGQKVIIQVSAISAVSERLNIQRTDARKLLDDARKNHRFNDTSTAQEQIDAALEVWNGIPEAFQNDIIAKKTKQQGDISVASKSQPIHEDGPTPKTAEAKKEDGPKPKTAEDRQAEAAICGSLVMCLNACSLCVIC